jgi:hypothetical protein
MTNNFHRRGIIKVSSTIIENHSDELANSLSQIEFLPLRVEFRFDYDILWLSGCSFMFDPVEEGDKIPEYCIEHADGKALVKRI